MGEKNHCDWGSNSTQNLLVVLWDVFCWQGTAIEATFWRDAADTWYDRLEEGGVRHPEPH